MTIRQRHPDGPTIGGLVMAQILAFPEKSTSRPPRPPGSGTAQVVLFPGIRVEYRECEQSVDLSRRPGRPGRDKAR
jgi:hypothetical protein